MGLPAAGQDVDTYCTKCKMELAHVIIAVANGRIARVQCKTCGSQHAHRDKRRSERKRSQGSTTRVRGAKSHSASGADVYETTMAGRDISRAKPYRATEVFTSDEVLNHKKFGIGLVTRVLDDGKIEVLFEDGKKTLAHGR